MACLQFKLVTVFHIFACIFISISSGFDPRVSRDEVEEKECVGSSNFFSSYGSTHFHYNSLRHRYQGCTYVWGNLEITNLLDPKINYDLSFLKHIRYVSGYVLIGFVGEVNQIPLTSLEIIRGNHTFTVHGVEYSLMVTLTGADVTPVRGLTTLMMPKLKEISNGKVLFLRNPSLTHINTVNWVPIMKGRKDAVHFGENPYNQSVSNQTDPDLCGGGGMWGADESLCQEVVPSPICDESCGTLCFGADPDQCCHETCAVGCNGPTASDCLRCRDFTHDGKCVPYCPDLTYQLLQECVKYTPLNAE